MRPALQAGEGRGMGQHRPPQSRSQADPHLALESPCRLRGQSLLFPCERRSAEAALLPHLTKACVSRSGRDRQPPSSLIPPRCSCGPQEASRAPRSSITQGHSTVMRTNLTEVIGPGLLCQRGEEGRVRQTSWASATTPGGATGSPPLQAMGPHLNVDNVPSSTPLILLPFRENHNFDRAREEKCH